MAVVVMLRTAGPYIITTTYYYDTSMIVVGGHDKISFRPGARTRVHLHADDHLLAIHTYTHYMER
jgi:hypothetical protein